ncbi:hypothetical protein EJB05_39333, partial [Eragrostis curvula]
MQHTRVLEDRIREQLLNPVPPPPSSYDTAWVAMVPAPGYLARAPRFPRCVDWILQNQHGDGSWGGPDNALGKDALSSTMACVLALATWDVGHEHVRKGLRFIGDNLSLVTADRCDTPVGFDIIFPGMVVLGIGMGLELPLSEADVDAALRLREVEMRRFSMHTAIADRTTTTWFSSLRVIDCYRCAGTTASGRKAFMAYVAEGLGNLQDWDQVMMYQRKNGSLFNSPSTTAAAAIHNYNDRALDYLDALIGKFGSSVPTAYPLHTYSALCMVDTLEKMGISNGFASEINSILDMAYRSWLDDDEEIILDMETCAVAFRLLRMHGYNIPTDPLAQFSEESSFHDSIQGYQLDDTKSLLELYRASQVRIYEEELVLENIGSWSGKLLKQQLCSNKISRSVEHALKFPFHATLERLEHKRSIESFRTESYRMLKSAYCCASNANEDILALAAHEFRSSQSVYQDELEYINRHPELRAGDGRGRLVRRRGIKRENENLATLIDRWDAHGEVGFCSERVEIVFRAVYETSKQIGAKAAAVQNRSVIHHIAELWADAARAMLTEAEWRRTGHVPSMEEYLRVAEVSFALGTIVPASVYFVGPEELPEAVVRADEYSALLRRTNLVGRLLNDLRTYGKESGQGKPNAVALLLQQHGVEYVAAAEAEVRKAIEAERRELLRLVVAERGAVPRPCRQVFWNMCKVMSLFYLETDGYLSPDEMMGAADAVLHQPLRVRA